MQLWRSISEGSIYHGPWFWPWTSGFNARFSFFSCYSKLYATNFRFSCQTAQYTAKSRYRLTLPSRLYGEFFIGGAVFMRNERTMLQKLTNTDSEIRNLEFLTSMTGSPIRDFLEIRNIFWTHLFCIWNAYPDVLEFF